ncbi:hypothetical protein [Pseudonocardia sp. H11422]|uniref:hypothetical protein n=1 Tax=Pseudonocardia sp. H11422 TaxID=2835866 RepID=UPI001BDBCC93|nr:hypothetical protein [Pseudonocardia sp. H11422]
MGRSPGSWSAQQRVVAAEGWANTAPRKHGPLSETAAIGAEACPDHRPVGVEDVRPAAAGAQVGQPGQPFGFGDRTLQTAQRIGAAAGRVSVAARQYLVA